MNKSILVSLTSLTVILLNSSVSFAGPFDFMGGGEKKETKSNDKKVDLDGMSKSGIQLILTVGKATLEFADASIVMLSALGKKEEAEKLKAALEEAKKKPKDEEAIKKFISNPDLTKGFETLSKTELGAKTKLNLSNKELLDSFLKIGGGLILDGKGVVDAANLVKEATGLVDLVKGDPMKYGLSALGTVNSVINSGKFIGDNVPQQAKHIQSFADKLVSYFKANKIPVPSQKELAQVAQDMLKG